jgi:hypothetical protein
MVSFTPRPLYFLGKRPQYQLIGRWVDSRAGMDELEKCKLFTLLGLKLRPLECAVRSQSLYRLRYRGSSLVSVLPLLSIRLTLALLLSFSSGSLLTASQCIRVFLLQCQLFKYNTLFWYMRLMPTFPDRGTSHGQRGGSHTAVISVL